MYREKGEVLNLEQKTITSVEVAEMVGKDHSKLLRDIRNYIDQFNQSKIGFVEFFSESNYKDGKGEIRPCYLVTKKGCEFIAHKLTGVKGTEFTRICKPKTEIGHLDSDRKRGFRPRKREGNGKNHRDHNRKNCGFWDQRFHEHGGSHGTSSQRGHQTAF